jgi:uncharacterized membrane protein YgdD (TMEM256/DUF423 family)
MFWIQISAFMGALGIGLGAFGAHALKMKLSPEHLEAYKTGVLYHLIHTPVVLALGIYERQTPDRDVDLAGGLIALGVVLFSGSLYTLTISGIKKLGLITPLGGLVMIAGWIAIGLTIG